MKVGTRQPSKERSESLHGLLMCLRTEAVDAARRIERAKIAEAENRIRLIDEALGRVDQGAYGFCEECGEEISLRRLAASPLTPYCPACER